MAIGPPHSARVTLGEAPRDEMVIDRVDGLAFDVHRMKNANQLLRTCFTSWIWVVVYGTLYYGELHLQGTLWPYVYRLKLTMYLSIAIMHAAMFTTYCDAVARYSFGRFGTLHVDTMHQIAIFVGAIVASFDDHRLVRLLDYNETYATQIAKSFALTPNRVLPICGGYAPGGRCYLNSMDAANMIFICMHTFVVGLGFSMRPVYFRRIIRLSWAWHALVLTVLGHVSTSNLPVIQNLFFLLCFFFLAHTVLKRQFELMRHSFELYEELKRVASAKDDFIASLSHEMRTPLNGIRGMHQNLMRCRERSQASPNVSPVLKRRAANQQPPIDEALAFHEALRLRNAELEATVQAMYEHTRKAERSSAHLEALVEDTLDVKRFELGNNAPFEHAPLSLPSLVRDCAENVQQMADRKGVLLKHHIDPSVEAAGRCMGDARRLRQVVYNLLTNAIKFTPAGKKVEIRLAARTRYGATTLPLLLTVRDEGVGIAKDDLPLIFLKYIKAGTKYANQGGIDKHSGAGIGLSLVKSIVESYDGSVDVESELGVGSAFRVRLDVPLLTMDTELAEAGGGFKSSTILEEARKALEGCHVLVADDVEMNRDVMCTMLRESLGCTSEEAEDGTEAVAAVRASMKPGGRRFDACFMDIQMHEMSGLEAAAAIRELEASNGNERLRIIALTGFASAEDRERCLVHMDAHMTKPVKLEAMAAKLLRLVTDGREDGVRRKTSPGSIITPTANDSVAANHWEGGTASDITAAAAAAGLGASPCAGVVSPCHSAGSIDSALSANPTFKKTRAIDWAALMSSVCNNKGFALRILTKFDAASHLKDLGGAVEARDAERLSRRAHAIKGVVSLLQASEAMSVCKQLEQEAKDLHTAGEGHDAKAWPQLVELVVDVREQLARVSTDCNALLADEMPTVMPLV